MYEKVNPSHPDKIADRIAGAIVDLAYVKDKSPKIAVEVLIGHEECNIIIESNVDFEFTEIQTIVNRIAEKPVELYINFNSQDAHLAKNQDKKIRCGDNGVFKGVPVTAEEMRLTALAKSLYRDYRYDGKYLINNGKFTICQSHAKTKDLKKQFPDSIVNPLGDWTGGINVDTGCTNRKLGSDMGNSVTGSGLHGKDLSKADVSVNVYAFLKAQITGEVVELTCSIGDTEVDGKPYSEIVEIAEKYIKSIGGFERFAEWGLIR